MDETKPTVLTCRLFLESESWRLVRPNGLCGGPARHRHAAALLGPRLLVHAGRCDLRACNDLWLFDTGLALYLFARDLISSKLHSQ